MIGRELASGNGKPGRFLIDADGQDLLSLQRYGAVSEHLKRNVLPNVKETLESRARQETLKWSKIEAVASAAVEVRRVRGEALKVTIGGLRAMYRTLELPGKHPLKDAHATLDAALPALRREKGKE